MVERCKQRGSFKTVSSSSSESVSAERRRSRAAGATAPCQGQEAVESAGLSEDSDTGEAEAAAGPSEDMPFYDPECAGLLSAGITKLVGVLSEQGAKAPSPCKVAVSQVQREFMYRRTPW